MAIADIQPGQWYKIPNSRLDQAGAGVYPPSPSPPGTPATLMTAWGGSCTDTVRNRVIVHGGGHGDYAGNELYAFGLATLAWTRPFGPTPNGQIPAQTANGTDAYNDGNPCSVHTYCGLLYIPGRDLIWRGGGSRYSGSGAGSRMDWLYSPTTNLWTSQGTDPSMGVQPTYVYDRVTHAVYGYSDQGVFKKWDVATNTWSNFGVYTPSGDPPQSAGDMGGINIGEEMGVALDEASRIFVAAGNGRMIVVNLATGVMSTPTSSGAGASAIVAKRGPGLAYDPVSRQIVGHYGGATTYSLNTTTWAWTTNSPAGSNTVIPPQQGDGSFADRILGGFPFSKWQYIPSKNVFLIVNSVSSEVYAYRLNANPYPNRTWVSKASPSAGQGPGPGGACKHTRMTYDSRRSVIVNSGGDYNDSVASDNGNAHIWQRDIFNIPSDNSWTNRHGYCSLSGQLMPSAPDNVGFCYDSLRDRYYTIPGFYNDVANIQPNCPGRTLTMSPVQFNPSATSGVYSAVTWSTPPGGYGGDLGATFATYDPVGDKVYRFRDTGSLKMEILDVTAGTWSQVTAPFFADVSNPNVHGDQSVIDVLGRAVYCYLRSTSVSLAYLLKFNISTNTFTRALVPTTVSQGLASTGNTDIETWMAFDPISRKILLPSYNAISYSGQVLRMGIFDVDAGTWEIETPNLSGMNMNTIGFDAAAGVMIGFGRSSGASNQFYYRYGGAAAAPGDTTPPTVSITSPSAGASLTGTVTVSASASDNIGVVGVQFKLDGANLGSEDTTVAYSISWDTTTASNGTHVLTATARDAAGNTTTSTSVSVTVNNTGAFTSYSTTFPLTENPISEGGVWAHTTNQWTAVRTSGGNAFGTNGITNTYDDSYALLTGFSSSVNDYEATCVLYKNPLATFNVTHEVALLARMADTSSSVRGYEFLFAHQGEIQIMRWNGGFGDFTDLLGGPMSNVIGRPFQTGDVFKAKVQGSTLTLYVNGAQIAQVTSSTWPTGRPGINMFIRPSGNSANFAMSSYNVGQLTVPSPPAAPTNLRIT